MGSYNILESVLKDILSVLNPGGEDRQIRLRVISDLREVVESVETFRGATVKPFGSFVSNLTSRWGDLDISIDYSNGSYISSAGRNLKQSLLAALQRALSNKGGCHRLRLIAHARVPILKFESIHQNISCDVSIDNLSGQMKSKFLFWISEMDGRFRDMVLLVKEWAKAQDINNPKSGKLNSYSLSLLVIFHFQTCVPAILPPIKDIYPGDLVDSLRGNRANAERQIEEICAANIARFRSDKYRNINRSSVAHLFVSFLQKFSDISLKASELGISPFTGKWEHIGSNKRRLSNNRPLIIEDPFERSENAARTVTANNLAKISNAFEMTHSRLTSVNQSRSALLPLLTRRKISNLIVETPVRYSIYNNGQLGTRPQIYKAVHSPSQAQRQFHNGTPSQAQRQSVSGTPSQAHRQSRNGTPSQAQRQTHNGMREDGSYRSMFQHPGQQHPSQPANNLNSQLQRMLRLESDASQQPSPANAGRKVSLRNVY